MAISETEAAEMIERHVEFVVKTEDGDMPVHLAAPFVQHFKRRADGALPIVSGISTLPIALPNGELLSGRGLDRRSGIVFRIPPNLWIPSLAECTDDAVAKAMRFLCDKWLCDVATDCAGKCVAVACALSIIERMLLPERPAYLIAAGQRGGGKTTLSHMISMAVLGTKAAAAAWSPNEEERRKALFAYLAAGVAFLLWDNIPLGAAIGCPSIERALTTETYSDRVLGLSEFRAVPAYTTMGFTGNNITARGDLASRTLALRLAVDRPDPENREFKHADPIAWTQQHRARILASLYTILLGNPRFRSHAANRPAETRFKPWWHLVGAAVEHAAARCGMLRNDGEKGEAISFKKLFIAGEQDDEQSACLAEVLKYLRSVYCTNSFKAAAIADICRKIDLNEVTLKANLEVAAGRPIQLISTQTISQRLRSCVDRPTRVDKELLTLTYRSDHEGGRFEVKTGQPPM
jgi:hypothetical protein